MALIWIVCLLALAKAANVTYNDLALKRCELDGYETVESQWSIHGLWPEYNKTNWPQFCDSLRYKEFQPQTIAAFRDLMNKYWYVCDSALNNWAFWVHEWKKHGTCQPLPPAVYFRRTIDMFLEAQRVNWYGCCDSTYGLVDNRLECLIHINRSTYKWLGKCLYKSN